MQEGEDDDNEKIENRGSLAMMMMTNERKRDAGINGGAGRGTRRANEDREHSAERKERRKRMCFCIFWTSKAFNC